MDERVRQAEEAMVSICEVIFFSPVPDPNAEMWREGLTDCLRAIGHPRPVIAPLFDAVRQFCESSRAEHRGAARSRLYHETVRLVMKRAAAKLETLRGDVA